jgi:hypothetical protein
MRGPIVRRLVLLLGSHSTVQAIVEVQKDIIGLGLRPSPARFSKQLQQDLHTEFTFVFNKTNSNNSPSSECA